MVPPEADHISDNLRGSLSGRQGAIYFLGSGTARFALDSVSSSSEVWCGDSSYAQVLQFNKLLTATLNFWEVETKNQLEPDRFVKNHQFAIPSESQNKAQEVQVLWTDCLSSPFADGSFDSVASIFFSDVVPLPELFKEVDRLLKPNGQFFHYGPLDYHFQEIQFHYAYAEFREYFVKRGYRIVSDDTIEPHNTPPNERRMVTTKRYICRRLVVCKQ